MRQADSRILNHPSSFVKMTRMRLMDYHEFGLLQRRESIAIMLMLSNGFLWARQR
jgi:hypothetical protein